MAKPVYPHAPKIAPDEKLTPEKRANLEAWNAYNNPQPQGGGQQPTGAPWGYSPTGAPLGPNGGILVNKGMAFPGAGYFNDPANIASTFETYKDNVEGVPDWLDWGGVEAAYRYMQATQGADSKKWMWLSPDDQANSFLSGLQGPPAGSAAEPYQPAPTTEPGADWTAAGYKPDGTFDINQIPVAQRQAVYKSPGFDITQYDPATREAMLGDAAFPWDDLPDWQRSYYSIVSNPKIMAAPMALAGAKAGSIAGPIGKVVGGIGGYLLGAIGGQEYDPTGGFDDQPSLVAKGMYLLNRASEAAEQAIGYTAQLSDAAIAGMQGNQQAAEAAKKMVFDKEYRSATWEAGRVAYEYADTPMKNLAPILFSFGQVFNPKNWDKKIGGLPELAGPGEDFVIGKAEPVLKEAAVGTNLLTGETQLVTDSQEVMRQLRLSIVDAYEQGATYDDVRDIVRRAMGEAGQYVGSQVQDLALQTYFDPLNVVDTASGKAAGLTVDLIARRNPDMAAKITANPQLMATMFRSGTGVIEPLVNKWGDLVRSGAVGAVDELTAFDRWAGGLDAQGRIKALSPDAPKNWFGFMRSLTPESKARTAVYTMSDNLKAMLLDATPEDFVRVFRSVAGGDMKAARDMGAAFLGSPESYTFLPILKDFEKKAGGLLDVWQQGEAGRNGLLTVSRILGENPGDVLKRFIDGDAKPDFERLVDAARKSDDPAARDFVAEVEAGRITAESLADEFGIFKQVPYHPDEWKATVYDAFMEHVGERVKEIYKLAPDKQVFQTIKTLKSVQSLLLLSLSPSYLINNVVNNAVTMASDGLFGTVPPWVVDKWMTRFELEPTRISQGIGAIGDVAGKMETEFGKAGEGVFKAPEYKSPDEIIGAATRATGINAAVQRVIGAVNNKVGVFANLSGKFEQMQSKQAFSTAMRRFWGNLWSRGRGFERMPAALELSLKQAGVDPAIVYEAIEGSMNWREVEAMLKGSEKLGARYQVSRYISAAAEGMNKTPAEVRDLLGAAGVMDVLEATIARAKDGSQIAGAFAGVEQKARRWVDMVSAQELRGMAEANAQRVQTEGYAGAHDIFIEQFQRLEKRWVDNYVEWENAHAMAQAAPDDAAKSAIYRAQRERSIANWRRYFEYEAATWKGITDAFGMTDERGRKFLAGITEYQKQNQTFFREYADAVNEHFNKIFDTREQALADWNGLVDEFEAKWQDVTINKKKVWMDLDEQLAGWFEEKYGAQAGMDARKWLQDKANFHDEMNITMRQFRSSTKMLPAEIKRAAWAQFVADEYVPMIRKFVEIAQGGEADTYAGVSGRPKPPRGGGPAAPATELFTPENTVRVQEMNQMADAHAADVWETAAKYGVYGIDETGAPVRNAALNLIKTVKKWGGTDGATVRTFQDITPGVLEKALTNKAEWERMQAEFDAAIYEPAPKPGTDVEAVKAAEAPTETVTVPEVPIDPMEKKRGEVLASVQRKTLEQLPAPIQDGLKRALKAMEDEVTAEHGDSLLQWLRRRGGINMQYLADLTGESKPRREWGPGVFTNRTGTQYALDTVAREAADYGYLTPDQIADDMGVRAITEMLQRELGGEKVYPVGKEALPEWYKGVRAGGNKKGNTLAAIDRVRTSTDGVKYGKATATELAVKEEAFNRLADEAAYDARLAELTGWPFDMEDMAGTLKDIEGRFDPNDLDGLRVLQSETMDFLANLPETIDDATLMKALDLNTKLSETIDIHESRAQAEAVISSAEVRAQAEMTRRTYHERLVEVFGLEPDEADTTVAVLDGVSEYWAQATGRNAAEWWSETFAGIERGGDGELMQLAPVNRKMTNAEVERYAGALVREGERALREAVSYEGDRAGRVALLDAAHKIDPAMAERVATQAKGALLQGAKGAVSFLPDGKAIIRAFEGADVSTVIHENGHVFLPMLDRLGETDARAKADASAVRGWMTEEATRLNAERTAGNLSAEQVSAFFVDADGKPVDAVTPFDADGNYTRAGQEMFARAFERYLTDGVAPVAKLARAFEQFKQWMVKIYHSITGSGLDINLNAEVRAVFDRLVAGDPELNRVTFGATDLKTKKRTGRTETGTLFQNTPDNPVLPVGGYEEMTGTYSTSRVLDEAWAEQVGPVLDAMKAAALDPKNAGPDYVNIPDMAAMDFKRYMQRVKGQMATAKRATVKYGESARDFALLSYHKQYGFDKIMQVAFPYQFFTTRSMTNWALRAVDRPGMMATYARLKRFQNQYENNLPERLRDKVWMPMPFLPEWAGGGVWVNPNPAIFPFENFLTPMKAYAQNRIYEANNATYIIQRWADEGKLSQSAAQEALKNQSGPAWERAVKAAQAEGGESPMDYFTMLYGPALYATLPYYLATGKKALASGWPSSPLPITRTGKALETAFKGTGLEWLGDTVGGALQWPENKLREYKGLNEFGEWGDFYIDRQLANMAAEGKYTSQEVRQAMIERSGTIFDEAVERVNMEYLAKTPGALPLYGAAHGARLDEVLGSLLPSMFSGGLLPEGELEQKGLKGEYNLAWDKYKAGDKEALTTFFDTYPEYEARLALRDEPDERLRNFLASEIWDRYMDLGKTYRKQAGMALGPEFQEFLGNSSELTDSLDVDKLARWAQVLGGMVPKVEETQAVVEDPQAINWYDPTTQGTLDQFYAERDEKFPNYWFIQSGYFAQPKSKQAAYLMKFPELKAYWDWKDGWEQRYPEMQPYFSGEVFKQIDTSGWPDPLVYQATMYALTGQRLTAGAEAWLEQIWVGMGRPYGSLWSWLSVDVSPALRTRVSGMGSQVGPVP